MMLAITTNSFHYKYYLTLRKIWGLDNLMSDVSVMSLCVYSQFVFWMTIATAIVSPILLMGWIELKLARLIYKVCSYTKIGQCCIDFIDRIFELDDKIADASWEMNHKSPAFTLVKVAVAVLIAAFLIFLVVGFIIFGTAFIVHIFMNIPEYIMGSLHCIALGIFYVCCSIGWALCNAVFWIGYAIKMVLITIAMYAGGVVLVGGLLALFTLVSIVVVKTAFMSQAVKDFFGFKVNGFQEARSQASKRRKIESDRREQEKWDREEELKRIQRLKDIGEIPLSGYEKFCEKFIDCIVAFIDWFKSAAVSRTAKVKGGSVKVMSGLGVAWETLKSIKDGVCPFVQFVDEEDIDKEEEKND